MCISRKLFAALRLGLVSCHAETEPGMPDRIAESTHRIDPETSKVIAKAVGERLRTDVQPEESKLPLRLQFLLDQLRAQDNIA